MDKLNIFLSQLSETNATLNYFTDFKKIKKSIREISIKLNQLNYLIGEADLRRAIFDLFEENPKVFQVLDILVAVRKDKKVKVLNGDGTPVLLENYFTCPDDIFEYMSETGLAEIFINSDITNLVDYVFGIEVSLDTNARKNRSGNIMRDIVQAVFEKNGVPFESEVSSTLFPEITSLGKDIKRFDFVVTTRVKKYLIEVNFYNTGGSKPNEIARSYSDIAPKINKYPNYEFVWITDGQGWLTAKNKLSEALNNISSVYNISTLAIFVQKLQQEILG